MGQEHPVIIHHIVAQNTLDERVMHALTDKAATQKSLLDALKDFVITEGGQEIVNKRRST